MTRFLTLILCIAASFSLASAQDAIVDATYGGKPGARVDSVSRYATIAAALQSIPASTSQPFVIYIKNGTYKEKLQVDRGNVHFIGESQERTIITYDASGDTPAPAGGTYGTRGSFTLQISAPDFRAENLTIENSFDYPANADKPDNDPTKVHNPQAVALMTTAECDRAVFCHCTIRGFQDTLFADAGRHYFSACRILGHVDFIFGAGQAIFENCDIVSRNRLGKNPSGYITAPSTSVAHPYGFVFIDSRLIKETPDVPPASVRLGRPWHPGANPRVNGSAVFIRCFMDDHLGPEGYARISALDSTGHHVWFEVGADSRFFEYGSFGPGAIKSSKRPCLDDKEMVWYSKAAALNGWNPECKAQ